MEQRTGGKEDREKGKVPSSPSPFSPLLPDSFFSNVVMEGLSTNSKLDGSVKGRCEEDELMKRMASFCLRGGRWEMSGEATLTDIPCTADTVRYLPFEASVFAV